MPNRANLLTTEIVTVLFLAQCAAGQITGSFWQLDEKIKRSELIITGEVIKEIPLSPPNDIRFDAEVLVVKVSRTLKGSMVETVEILDTFQGSHRGPLDLLNGVQYLFFLEKVVPDSQLVANYGLSGTPFFYPYGVYPVGGERSVVDLSEDEGLAVLRRTEDSLGVVHVPPYQQRILTVPRQYATIQAAIDASQRGDHIQVWPGTYDEIVTISGKDSLTIFTVGGVTNSQVRGFKLQQSNAITINGFEVDASGTNKHGIVLMGGNNQNTDITIEGCRIKYADGDQSGISVARGNPRTRIVNNLIFSNGRNGITIIDATGGPHYIINNTIVNNGWNGVSVARQHVIYLVNNILSFNGTRSGATGGRYGVLREAMTGQGNALGITLLNNLLIGNNGSISSTSSKDLGNFAQMLDATDSENWTTIGSEGAGVAVAPTLTLLDVINSATNPLLIVGSFAIDKGLLNYGAPDPAGAVPLQDYERDARPIGGGVDIGADEKSN